MLPTVLLAAVPILAGAPEGGADPNPRIRIDFAKTRGEVSPYIYGQFIEHLGRCIYGGIWAEMLEDRKFYNWVGHPQSPWRVAGEADGFSATMDSGHAYAGALAVELALDRPDRALHGIRHGGLGLVGEKTYVGRVVLAGLENAATVEVGLRWGPGPDDRASVEILASAGEYRTYPFRLVARGTTGDGALEIGVRDPVRVLIGTASLMPGDNVQGMRADTMERLRELGSPVYRWPGGNFVSGYDWRDGIGDRDRRPPRKNPAWQGIESNDFGIDEFVAFCRLLGTEPLAVVNTGLGSVDLARGMVEYANGTAETPWGRIRAANGHAQPHAIRFWGVGNEMYGNWQLGHVPLDVYVARHNRFAKAMREADPSIVLVAVGSVGPWTQGMLKGCRPYFDYMSEHFYRGDKPDPVEHAAQTVQAIEGIVRAYEEYQEKIPALKDKPVRVALDEWNYWYGKHVYGELGVVYHLKDAIGIARGLHAMIRANDLFYMANLAQTVNVIGAIKTTKTSAFFDTIAYPLMLYRWHFGSIAVEVADGTGPLDVVAAWTKDRERASIALINPTGEPVKATLDLANANLAREGLRYIITGPDPMATNEPDKPAAVKIESGGFALAEDGAIEIPRWSVVLIELAKR
ncbi:MAG: alpha-N-arabinofuranosidase [Planctomycetes bacterium]|nr:alpha-N-arabinofuranosidase [Planctomycetota bacterium]